MKEQEHTMRRLRIDFELEERDQALSFEVQDRFSKLTHTELIKSINSIFDEFTDALTWLKIDQLEIDLGTLALEDLEKEAPAILEAELRKALQLYLHKNNYLLPTAAPGASNIRLLDLLIFFLEKGHYPWWITKEHQRAPRELLELLFREKPKELASAISAAAGKKQVIVRMVQIGGTKGRTSILKLLFPHEAPKLLPLIKDFELIYKRNPMANLRQSSFSALLWQSTFDHLFNLPTHQFESQQFITALLAKLSIATQSNMGAWIESTEKPGELSATFIQVINELEEREVIKVPQATQKVLPNWLPTLLQNLKMPFKRTAEKILTYYIATQQLPKLETEDWNHLALVFTKLWELFPNQAIGVIDVLLADKLYREKSLVILPTPLLKKVLRVKFPMLYVHLLQLSQDLLLVLKPYFQGQTFLELEQRILNHYLLYFAAHHGKSFDLKDLLRSAFLTLAGPQQTNYVKLLETVRDTLPKRTRDVNLASDLIQYLNLILLEEGLKGIRGELLTSLTPPFNLADKADVYLEEEIPINEKTEVTRDDLRILSFYLENGALEIGLDLTDVREATLRLLRRAPIRLNRWFRSSKQQAQVLTRMVAFFTTEILVPLFNTFKPDLGDFGVKLKMLLQSLALIPEVPEKEDKYFWKLFKSVVVEEVNETFNPYVFTQKILVKIVERNEGNSEKARAYLYALIHENPKPAWYRKVFPEVGEAVTVLTEMEKEPVSLVTTSEAFPEQEVTTKVERKAVKDDLRIFSFYLENGALEIGWNLIDIRQATVRLLQRSPIRLNRWFRSSTQQAQVLTRMVDFFSTEILVPLFNVFKPNLGDFGVKLKTLLQSLELIPKAPEKKDKYFWNLFKSVVIEEVNEAFSPYVFTQKILTIIIDHDHRNGQKAQEYLYALIHENPKPRWFSKVFPVIGEETATNREIIKEPVVASRSAAIKEISTPKKQTIMEEKNDNIYAVENAGLAILSPYLPVLFERSGLLENGAFRDDKAKQEAICLLEYLVTGKQEWSEHQLVLNKILCGYPTTEPLELNFELPEDWTALSDSLLMAVIAQWAIIGEVSVDSFRETFLLRAGNLAFRKERWHLQVESKSFDVLMRELPWAIGVINYSWLENVVQVDWKY
ncbi:MAG: contractile injection system tape measure protein [Saprospiraceae bacterium]